MPRRAPWVVVDVATCQPIFKSLDEHVAGLRARGYRLVLEREGYVVLHLPGG
ncbi:hypothetical protein [Nonomuraea solani]|nr:hypothetical protein [Nonomuraea solani]